MKILLLIMTKSANLNERLYVVGQNNIYFGVIGAEKVLCELVSASYNHSDDHISDLPSRGHESISIVQDYRHGSLLVYIHECRIRVVLLTGSYKSNIRILILRKLLFY